MNKQNNKFNIAGFEELINELAEMDSPYKDKMQPMVDVFKDLATVAKELEEVQKNGTPSPEDVELLMNKLKDSQKNLQGAFSQFCEGQGTTMDELMKQMADPKNFSTKEWENAAQIERTVKEKINFKP